MFGIGYPVHAVARYRERRTQHGVLLTDWTAACGATGHATGTSPFSDHRSARKAELCRGCFPAGHRTHLPSPVREES